MYLELPQCLQNNSIRARRTTNLKLSSKIIILGIPQGFRIRASSHYLRFSNSRPKFQKATQNVETKLKPTKVWAHNFIWPRRIISLKFASKMMFFMISRKFRANFFKLSARLSTTEFPKQWAGGDTTPHGNSKLLMCSGECKCVHAWKFHNMIGFTRYAG